MPRPLASLVARSMLASALAMASARPAAAQYTVSPVQPLAFGYLTQGVTEVVPYTDTFRRGVMTIGGTGVAYVRLILPTALTSPSGATIPLQFLFGDAAEEDAAKAPQAFDPAGSVNVNLNKGTANLLLGGRALTAANQLAGVYSATIVVVVSPTKF